MARMSVDAYVGCGQALSDWEGTEDRAGGISLPTLVIVGELDSAMLLEGSGRLVELISDSRLQVVPEAGHSPQWERPELFNAALRQFLERQAS